MFTGLVYWVMGLLSILLKPESASGPPLAARSRTGHGCIERVDGPGAGRPGGQRLSDPNCFQTERANENMIKHVVILLKYAKIADLCSVWSYYYAVF